MGQGMVFHVQKGKKGNNNLNSAYMGQGDGSKPLKKSLKSDSKKTHVLKKASIRIITWLIAGNSDDIRAIIF